MSTNQNYVEGLAALSDSITENWLGQDSFHVCKWDIASEWIFFFLWRNLYRVMYSSVLHGHATGLKSISYKHAKLITKIILIQTFPNILSHEDS